MGNVRGAGSIIESGKPDSIWSGSLCIKGKKGGKIGMGMAGGINILLYGNNELLAFLRWDPFFACLFRTRKANCLLEEKGALSLLA